MIDKLRTLIFHTDDKLKYGSSMNLVMIRMQANQLGNFLYRGCN